MTPEGVSGPASLAALRRVVNVAMGREAGSVLLKNVRLLNVFTLDIETTHVLVAGELIAAVGPELSGAEAEQTLDLEGRYLVPGLIDGHVHIESSLVTPAAYTRGVLPRGVTGVVCDPHEIANVAGVPGIRWLLDSSEGLPLDVWVGVPSCVPATPLETSGATLDLADIAELLKHERVVGVAELMSFPAILAADEENLGKILLAEAAGKRPEGHAPSVSGRALQAYLAAGISSDHEATTLEEGREKLAAGMFLMIREGSVTRNLEALLPLVDPKHGDRIGFVTDDRLPHDLLDEGGVDYLVRRAIAAGVEPAYAVRCATYNTAAYFRLPRRGAVAPGYVADMAVVDDLKAFEVSRVYKAGRPVAEGGELVMELQTPRADSSPVRDTVTLAELRPDSFKLRSQSDRVRCIKLVPGQVLTEQIEVAVQRNSDEVHADVARDLLKLVCIERHGHSDNVAVGLVTGFGLRAGALASTVGHDHHNLLAVTCNDADVLVASRRLEAIGGGFVAVRDGEVLAELALPIAGLVTDEPLSAVRAGLDTLEQAARALGATIPAPFMTLSFLGLEVIPELRLTDLGLVDVMASALVPLEL